jgi:hypothetical protein
MIGYYYLQGKVGFSRNDIYRRPVMNQRIYGYYFSVVVEKGEKGWVG